MERNIIVEGQFSFHQMLDVITRYIIVSGDTMCIGALRDNANMLPGVMIEHTVSVWRVKLKIVLFQEFIQTTI